MSYTTRVNRDFIVIEINGFSNIYVYFYEFCYLRNERSPMSLQDYLSYKMRNCYKDVVNMNKS